MSLIAKVGMSLSAGESASAEEMSIRENSTIIKRIMRGGRHNVILSGRGMDDSVKLV